MHDHRVKGSRNKSARNGVVVAGLLIVLGGLSARQLIQAPAESAAADAPPPATADPAPAGEVAPLKIAVDWNTSLARDPFTSRTVFPPKVAVAPEPEVTQGDKAEELAQLVRRTIKLNGTFLGSHPLAIMNGRMYHTGDNVEGYLLREIGSREVVLEKDGIKVLLAEREVGR